MVNLNGESLPLVTTIIKRTNKANNTDMVDNFTLPKCQNNICNELAF